MKVERTATAARPKTQTLCSINFDRDTKRPARVDNEAKACLDDVALNLQRQADATARPVGDKASATPVPKNKKAAKAVQTSQRSALNAKAYLVTEEGYSSQSVSATRIADANRSRTTSFRLAQRSITTYLEQRPSTSLRWR